MLFSLQKVVNIIDWSFKYKKIDQKYIEIGQAKK